MLNTKLVVLAALWVLGLILDMAGSPIHLLLGIALCVVVVEMLGRHGRVF